MLPPRRPQGRHPKLPTPAEKFWRQLSLHAMPTLGPTEHSRASLRSAFSHEDASELPSEEQNSVIILRNHFSRGWEDGASEDAPAAKEASEGAHDATTG